MEPSNCSTKSAAAFQTVLPLTPNTKATILSTSKTGLTRNKCSVKEKVRRNVIQSTVASPSPISIPSRYTTPQPFAPSIPILGQEQFERVLQSHLPEEPIVIMFHARWCRTCKTLRAKLPKIANDYPTIHWYDVDFALLDNKPLCWELGVKLLPTFRIYTGGANNSGFVDQFSTGPFASDKLIQHINSFFQSHPNANF